VGVEAHQHLRAADAYSLSCRVAPSLQWAATTLRPRRPVPASAAAGRLAPIEFETLLNTAHVT